MASSACGPRIDNLLSMSKRLDRASARRSSSSATSPRSASRPSLVRRYSLLHERGVVTEHAVWRCTGLRKGVGSCLTSGPNIPRSCVICFVRRDSPVASRPGFCQDEIPNGPASSTEATSRGTSTSINSTQFRARAPRRRGCWPFSVSCWSSFCVRPGRSSG